MCSRYAPQIVSITWVPADQSGERQKLLWESRPVHHFAWAGVEQHTNSTQISRALGLLYTLTGNFGDKGETSSSRQSRRGTSLDQNS
ncbi:MAG: hypothetical protein R2839_01665 [Thermomicrobiales bacterium]